MKEDDTRRGRVKPEHVDEAKRLRAIYDQEPRGTQAEFGEKWDIGNQSAVGNMLNGKQAISLLAGAKFAKALNCSIADFSPRLAVQAAEIGSLAYPPSNVTTLPRGSWPFSQELRDTVEALDAAQFSHVEATLRALAESLMVSSKHDGNAAAPG